MPGARWDEDAQLLALDTTAGRPHRRRRRLRHGRAAASPRIPDAARPRDVRGRRRSTPRAGTTTTTSTGKRVAVIGTGASAIQFVPQHPAAGGASCTSSSARRRGSCPTPTGRSPSSSAASTARFPAAPARCCAGASTGRARRSSLRLHADPRFAEAARRRSAPAPPAASRCRTPSCARSSRPDYAMGCKRVLISNDYYPALTQPNVEVVTDGIAEVRAHSIVAADGIEREVDAIIFGTGFHVHGHAGRPSRVRGRDGRSPRRGVATSSMQAYLRHHRRRLPEPVHAAGPEHRPRPHLDGLHDRGADRLRASTRCARWSASGWRTRRGPRPRPRRAYNERDPDEGCAAPCGTPAAARAGTWTASGRNTTLWPGFTWQLPRAHPALRPGALRSGPGGRTSARHGARRRLRSLTRGTPSPRSRASSRACPSAARLSGTTRSRESPRR